MMKSVTGCIALLTLATASADDAELKQKYLPEAKVITQTFATELQKELQQAMQSGGPMNALSVCHTEALPITAKVSAEQNARIRRVSLKNRNPQNVPDEWQRTVLESFDSRAKQGEDVSTMSASKIVQHGDKKTLSFMKAVPTGGVCLACHGSDIDVELQSKLSELYPDDRATGYAIGQVRGAIVVEKELF